MNDSDDLEDQQWLELLAGSTLGDLSEEEQSRREQAIEQMRESIERRTRAEFGEVRSMSENSA